MRLRLILFSTFVFVAAQSLAQNLTLSAHAKIHVITCGPSQDELYAAFGHSAFRVTDPAQGIDWVYNYGVFDFDQPNFYLNFARGYLNYKLAVGPYDRFVYVYQYYNRFVHEQVLSLDSAQRQRLFDFLQWNALPENQYYRYDYFYDNCATRIRDAMIRVFGDSVRFDGSYVTELRTFRQLTDLYLKPQPWGDLGIDLCLGLPMDKQASAFEHMFLPDHIFEAFANATLRNADSQQPLIEQNLITYAAIPDKSSASLFHPMVVFSMVFIATIVLTIVDIRRGRRTKVWDALLFTASGVVGLLLVFLWTATDHDAAKGNFNLLWALPTHLFVFLTLGKDMKPWVANYFMRFALLAALLLAAWYWLPQQLNSNLIPLVLALGLRAYGIGRTLKKEA